MRRLSLVQQETPLYPSTGQAQSIRYNDHHLRVFFLFLCGVDERLAALVFSLVASVF